MNETTNTPTSDFAEHVVTKAQQLMVLTATAAEEAVAKRVSLQGFLTLAGELYTAAERNACREAKLRLDRAVKG